MAESELVKLFEKIYKPQIDNLTEDERLYFFEPSKFMQKHIRFLHRRKKQSR
jgi:hypothetical protein